MTDKNKWKQPRQPPPPLFVGKKERDLVKQVNDELIERVIGQQIYYRFYHGHTKDERFKGFLKKAHVLQRMCEMTMAGKVTD